MSDLRAALGRLVDRLRVAVGQDEPSTADETAADTKFPQFSAESLAEADELKRLGMTSEEYVLDLVDAHGGRMRQANICEVSGWSKATVSRTLCGMEDAGQITRIRVGKGKVVCLPDAIPDERSAANTDSSDSGSSEPATGD
jgi:hypothetical protein